MMSKDVLAPIKQEIRDLFARYGSGQYTPTEEEKQIIEAGLDEILSPSFIATLEETSPPEGATPKTDATPLWLMSQGALPANWTCPPGQEGDIRPFDHELIGPCVEWKVVTAAVARRLERGLGQMARLADSHGKEVIRLRAQLRTRRASASALADRLEALAKAATPGAWALYTSNSRRRIGLADGYTEVIWPTVLQDGTADLSGKNLQCDVDLLLGLQRSLPEILCTLRGEPAGIKVYQLNDYEWYAGETLEACIGKWKEVTGLGDEELDNPRALTEEDLDRLKYTHSDEDERPLRSVTFRERLVEMADEGAQFPEFFATTEY